MKSTEGIRECSCGWTLPSSMYVACSGDGAERTMSGLKLDIIIICPKCSVSYSLNLSSVAFLKSEHPTEKPS